jgi:hypothetical protein
MLGTGKTRALRLDQELQERKQQQGMQQQHSQGADRTLLLTGSLHRKDRDLGCGGVFPRALIMAGSAWLDTPPPGWDGHSL